MKNKDVNLLFCWGNQAIDNQDKDFIRMFIINQFISDKKFTSSFVKIYNWFLNSNNFKKEVMADLIIIYMSLAECIIDLSDDLCMDIVDNASIETIGYYGNMITHSYLRKLCINKYWDYVFEYYDFTSHSNNSRYMKKKLVNEYGEDDK